MLPYDYLPADTEFIVNDDPHLTPITVPLPVEPEDKTTIANYGIAPYDQYFTRTEYPNGLRKLEREVVKDLIEQENRVSNYKASGQKIIDEIWVRLEQNQSKYQEEIEFIKREHLRILHGFWIYINGKPTHIDGWHYAYLNYWTLDTGKPEYRDRDRRWFQFARFIYDYKVDGRRTFFGFLYPKHRRDGATHKALCVGYFITIYKIGETIFGIQSFNDNNASEHFSGKLVPSWKKMPFFFRPTWSGNNSPTKKLSFSLSYHQAVGDELGTSIEPATTSNKQFFDGKKLHFYQGEEEGKTMDEDVVERWTVVKRCLSQGNGAIIEGFTIHPTTVADMKGGGGDKFYELCRQSMLPEQDPITNQTQSGMATFFMSAADGMEGFIGPHGESIIEKPTPEQAAYIGRKIGSRQYLEAVRNKLLKRGDAKSMRAYYNELLLAPLEYMDCFRGSGGDSGFNKDLIDKAEIRLRDDANATRIGDFMWMTDKGLMSANDLMHNGMIHKPFNGRVVWKDDKENGRWKLSFMPEDYNTNRSVFRSGDMYPEFGNKYISSSDPMQWLSEGRKGDRGKTGKLSNGGGAVFLERDTAIDGDDKDIEDWTTYRFVATYNNPVDSDDEFAEDMLMASVFFSSYHYPERNVSVVVKHFIKRGYGGYLLYQWDEKKGGYSPDPGFRTNPTNKQDLYNVVGKYIEYHFHREQHYDFVRQCKDNKGIDDMTHHDLFVACAGCLLGSQSRVNYEVVEEKEKVKMENVMRTFDYD